MSENKDFPLRLCERNIHKVTSIMDKSESIVHLTVGFLFCFVLFLFLFLFCFVLFLFVCGGGCVCVCFCFFLGVFVFVFVCFCFFFLVEGNPRVHKRQRCGL